ncbi:AzlC family ABC transporter permease [Bartonella tamiae]|uniref:Azaleucine resistance protein AzlC n=1 Tax=Bartonella tamiae Th239 TaxID=1094558 RepID=J1JUT5_9HYPH|nr:AzlC family ABC transporter permease [Bartonella tamiae]EJF88727.1 azaleucine resistance protein AzlC [Bartonella tamiae Th239]EJF95023.1 azaleucine resistance protein AzlC [Bartonella tamiae Th307]
MPYYPFSSNHFTLFKKGIFACIPTLLGYWAVGFACGAIGSVSGLSIYHILSLSIFVYAGSAQFLFYALIGSNASLLQIALAVGFINLRYLLINAYMAQYFSRSTMFEKTVGGLLMTDETFGVATQYARKNNNFLPFSWLLGLNLTAWFNWIIATLIGSLFASSLPDWLREALNFSLVGMFIGLIMLGWYASQTKIFDSIVMISSVAFIIFSNNLFNSNIAMICATIFSATIGMIFLWKTKGAKL